MEKGAVQTQLVSLVDVMPTLLDLVGIEVPSQAQGQVMWKPETLAAGSESGKKSPYAGPAGVGVGDYSAFSRGAYAGFGTGYQKQDSLYAGKRDEKKTGAYK